MENDSFLTTLLIFWQGSMKITTVYCTVMMPLGPLINLIMDAKVPDKKS